MSADFQLISTPNPAEFSFVAFAEVGKILQYGLPAVGTAYKDCPQLQGKRLNEGRLGDEIRNYVFCELRGDLRRHEDNHEALLFVRSRTQAERDTPFNKVWMKFGNHAWPDILLKLELRRDDSFPLWTEKGGNVVNSPRYYVHARYIPGVREGSRFEMEEYLSEVPYDIPPHRAPQPGAVMGETLTTEYHFPECLHDDLVIQDMQTGTTMTVNGVTESSGAGVIAGQYHPATNMITWMPYVVQDEQEKRNGLWYRQVVRVHPPNLPRARVRSA